MKTDDDDRKISLAAEAMIEYLASFAEDKDDDELVFLEGPVHELAEICGMEDYHEEIAPVSAGTLRRRFRAAKAEIARGDAP